MSKNVPGVLVIMLFISGSFYLTQHASATESSLSTITLPSRIRVGQTSSPEKISWTDLVNTQHRGSFLEKVSGTDNWPDAGARSIQQLIFISSSRPPMLLEIQPSRPISLL